MDDATSRASRLARIRDFLLRPSRFGLASVVAVGMIAGLVFWGGFNTGMDATNALGFCTSCHEMRDTVFEEYKQTAHYVNRSGVRAICSDCHVSKEWVHKFVRKIQASQELYGKFVSHVIDTPEKFESKRMELAQHVWATMKANDSHECRNCHSWEAMDAKKQSPRAHNAMVKGQKEGKTCIDCHKGIAHLLPKEFVEEEG
jgi:nitrate/TMAO reductase-like tetraheme cytochrome c subunit